LNDQLRVIARGQMQRKFGQSEYRAGGGAEWRLGSFVALRGHAIVGLDNAIMPEGDYLGELEYADHRMTWTFGVRSFDFTGARTTVFSPAVSWPVSERLIVGLRYAVSRTETNPFLESQTGHSAHARADYRMLRRTWLLAGYAAGVEDFENFSVDRIGDFRANTASGGIRVDLPTLTSVIGTYEHQWREGDVDMGRLTLGLQLRF
jgi:hypothetical protein